LKRSEPDPSLPYALVGTTCVRYEAAGPADGPPVLFLCGITVPLETFDANFRFLAEAGLRVYRFDYPGRGWSDRPRVPVSHLDDFAASAVGLLDVLGETRPVALVGLSMGGAVAAVLADQWPQRFGPVAFIDPLFFPLKLHGLRRLLVLPVVGDLVLGLAGRPLLLKSQQSDFHDSEACRRFRPWYLAPFAKPGLPQAILATWRSLESWDISAPFARLSASGRRFLVIWGIEDTTIPFALHEELRVLLGPSEFLPVPGAGHVPHWEKPEVVNPRLLNFFLSPS